MIVNFLRHAKTELNSLSGRDFDRILIPDGHEQCQEVKSKLNRILSNETKIYCSTAVRTRQTAGLIFGNQKLVGYFEELYLSNKETILEFICSQESHHEILIIGHNFGLSEIASYLSGAQVVMKTSGFIRLEFPGLSIAELSASTGVVKSVHRCNID
ncbi:histidine phosphatase family protein [Crocinitomicaceae bacterium]|nr:histidine phosphatase family protein [Crocinitomicaceae bacterium]MDB4340133.1 histidine phosphatase family protein [Crocinitomicaceae bacterium]